MPAQFLEAWLILESERFQFPVFREYYQERDVVMEERRMRTDDSARGSLLEQFFAAAYIAHPYHHPPIGWMSDLRHLTRRQGRDFFKQYYHPGNMIIGIVGHVDPAWVIEKAHEYFGDIPAGPARQRVTTVEPEQNGERRVTWKSNEMPLVVIGYHKPSAAHPDAPAFQALESILAGGRTSRLHRSLVNDKRIAAFAGASGQLPGDKYPNLFSVFAVPMRTEDGFQTAACEQAIHDEIVKLQRDGVTEAELQRVKTKARAGFIRSLTSNAGLARALTYYEAVHGDWRTLFDAANRIQAVTAEDVLRVARSTLVERNRTVAIIEPEEPPPWEQEPGDDTQEDK
jgi:predicted Zn-dependent peptidase